jgi:hypothetical protein
VAPQTSELPPVLAGVPQGFSLALFGGGVRMPAIQVAVETPVPPAPVVAEAAPYVPPVYTRKQDRN